MKQFVKIIGVIGIFASLITCSLRAQEDASFTHFQDNRIFYNPAGIHALDEELRLSVLDREQWWGGGSDRPSFRLFNATQYLDGKRMGFAVSFYEWNQNVETDILAKLAYSYHIQLGRNAYLALGLSAGVMQGWYKNLILPDGQMGVSVDEHAKTTPNIDLGFGLELYTHSFVFGLAAQHMPIKIMSSSKVMSMHMYGYVGYNATLGQSWKLFPMLSFTTALTGYTYSMDIQLRAYYRDLFFFGGAYKMDAASVVVGANIGRHFGISYACDIPIGKITNRFKWPSHELMLTFKGCVFCNSGRSRGAELWCEY